MLYRLSCAVLGLSSMLALSACSSDGGPTDGADCGCLDAYGADLTLDVGAGDGGDAHTAPDSGDPGAVWVKVIGSAETEAASDVIVDGAGNSYLVGGYKGQLQIGANTLDAGALYKDIFVVKFDAAGSILWARALATDGTPGRLGLSASGLLITGDFYGSSNFGGQQTFSTEAYNAPFVLELAQQDGALKWAQIVDMGSAGNGGGVAVAADGQGGAVVLGEFETQAGFGVTQLSTAPYASTLFLARLDDSGTFTWATSAVTAEPGVAGLPTALVVDGGAAFVCGTFQGELGFGTTSLVSPSQAAFVARADVADGSFDWALRLGSSNAAMARAMTISPSGALLVGGEFTGTLTVGTSEVSATGTSDAFVAQLAADDGAVAWGKALSSSGDVELESLAATGGSIWAAGAFSGTMTLAATTLTSASSSTLNAYGAQLDSSGAPLGGWSLSGTDYSQLVQLRALPGGALMAAGNFEGAAQTPVLPIITTGMQDAFLMRLATAF